MPQQHWELKMGMQSTGEKMPRESPELTTSQQNEMGSSVTICYLQLVLGYWPGSDCRTQGEKAPQHPRKPLGKSAPLLHKHPLVKPVSRIVLVKAFQSRTGSTSLTLQ